MRVPSQSEPVIKWTPLGRTAGRVLNETLLKNSTCLWDMALLESRSDGGGREEAGESPILPPLSLSPSPLPLSFHTLKLLFFFKLITRFCSPTCAPPSFLLFALKLNPKCVTAPAQCFLVRVKTSLVFSRLHVSSCFFFYSLSKTNYSERSMVFFESFFKRNAPNSLVPTPHKHSSLGFRISVGQNKLLENVTLSFRNVRCVFFSIL